MIKFCIVPYSIRNLITLVLNKLWLIGIFTFVFGLGSFLAPVRVQPRLYSFQGDMTSSTQGLSMHSVLEGKSGIPLAGLP